MSVVYQQQEAALAKFTAWAQTHIKGDEKGEAHIFLDHLFQAFGHPGSLELGDHEFRIRKAGEDGGGVSFADFVWKPIVLFEMKKRGEKLQKHYRQAFDYWTRLVPNRPRYVVLCNFDEFQVYDFETQMDSPVGSVPLPDLAEHYGPLKFLFPGHPKPRFQNDRVAVTREAADCLANCFRGLRKRNIDQPTAQRFILQMLVSLFAEDIDLLPKYFVSQLLDDLKSPQESFDLLGGLFEAMNNKQKATGGRFKDVDYFNGGLFAQPARVELADDELLLLRKAATYDWKKVQPEIFGTLFEHSLDDGSIEGTRDERRASGAHFTHPADIMKIVGPTIVEPWRRAIEGANTQKALRQLRERLQVFRVLDPACGSGNFLYIAYRELKRLEMWIYERLNTEFKKDALPGQVPLSFLTAQNFYGMDINPFAVELAKVTMMIARKLAIDELHISERALPLDNLDKNFLAIDALVSQDGTGADVRTPWPRADVIIGNPPFIGAKLLKKQLGPDHVKILRKLYPDVPGMADFCVYWIRRAHDHLAPCTADDPLAGRAGLVGTQNIRNNQSRVGGLDHVVKDGTIIEAVDNQPWSGEANVHVSIANWVKTKSTNLFGNTHRLWFEVQPSPETKKLWKMQHKNASKQYELNFREPAAITSALSDTSDISVASELLCNTRPTNSYNGQMLGHEGFLLTPDQRKDIVSKDPKSAEVIFPYLNGREALTGDGKPNRFVLDFGSIDQLQAASYSAAFDWVKNNVLPDRQSKANKGKNAKGAMRPHHKQFLSRWWQLSFGRPELISRLSTLPRYLACSLVTKRAIFMFVHSSIRPSNLLQVFTLADDYSFGVLQSSTHWKWFMATSSKLKSDYRFGENIWNTFPWPQKPTPKQVVAISDAARAVRSIREDALTTIEGGLRALYRMLELPGENRLKDAHAALDAAVLDAYGFSAAQDLLAQILALNLDVADKIAKGKPVTAPGIPSSFPQPETLVTDDCIKPA